MNLNLKKIWKFYNFFAILTVIGLNGFLISLLKNSTASSFNVEIVKWLGFFSSLSLAFCLMALVGQILASVMPSLLFFAYFIACSYHSLTRAILDYAFFTRNSENIFKIVMMYKSEIFSALLAGAILAFVIKKNYTSINAQKKYLALFSIPIFLIQFLLPGFFQNELFAFAASAFNQDAVIDYYQQFYSEQIANSIKRPAERVGSTNNNLSHLENIILVHIESLNAKLVSQKITPQFLKLAEEGIFLPEFYSNSVQTILAQENTLCALPSSFDTNIVNTKESTNINCLPKILKKAGYHSYFAKTFDLDFANTGKFMQAIGFDEIHADDIMNENDPKYRWGWREDVFFQRAFGSIKNLNSDKKFIYLEIGPTHHWPFDTPADQTNKALHHNPKNFQDRFENTLYLQDQYLENLWTEVNQTFPQGNFTLIIGGDHSFPYGARGPVYVMSEHYGFEENFLTSYIILFGDNSQNRGRIIKTKYSELDLMPTILDMIGFNHENGRFSRSMLPEIIGQNQTQTANLLIQPFSGRFLNIVDANLKYQYDASRKKFFQYDLTADPDEKKPIFISSDSSEIKKILANYFYDPVKK